MIHNRDLGRNRLASGTWKWGEDGKATFQKNNIKRLAP
jgi:hypothetical protein